MGGSGSTRRVVVEEDNEGVGVVKISDSVVRRLRGSGDNAGLPSQPEVQERPLPKPERLPSFERDGHARDLEAFYQEKLRILEEKNALVYRTTKEQFAKAVEEVEQKFLKHTGSALCQDFQKQVYKCYKANPEKALMCSPEVRQFTSCVETARQLSMFKDLLRRPLWTDIAIFAMSVLVAASNGLTWAASENLKECSYTERLTRTED